MTAPADTSVSQRAQPARSGARAGAAGAVALLLAVGLLTYGFSLRLPFFLDDMVHFRWLAWQDLARIWRTARSFGYYRPLPFSLWKLLYLLQGRHDPLTLHALNLALHLLNASLVFGLVAGRGRESRVSLGLGAALLFLLYPFSYQAVPWVGSLTHPLVTALILGSLLLHFTGRARNAGLLTAASVGLALLAPFAHETGVLIAPLLLLLLVTDEPPLSLRRALRRTLPYWACAALGCAIWLLVPKEPRQLGLLNLEARWQNAVYFLQGLAFPVSPLATRVMGLSPRLDDLRAIVLVSLPVVVLWSALLWRAGRGRLVALSLGWFALTVAPAWAVLKFSYVVDGPRLLYEASVGAALFWAVPLDLRWATTRRRVLGRGLAALVVIAAGLGGWRFVRARAALYEQMRLAVAGLLAALPEDPAAPVLCVNYPWWLAPREPAFAVGHEGVTLVPPYSGVADLLWLHTGVERSVTGVVLPDVLDPWRYYHGTVGAEETLESLQARVRRASRVVVTNYAGNDVAVYDAGGLEGTSGPPALNFLASFDGRVGLLYATPERQGPALRVVLGWQCWQPVAQDVTVFLHFCDRNGKLLAQADGYPVMRTSRPASWQPGDEWRDVRMLSLPDELPAGEYTLKVGLYPVAGGPRLQALGPSGQRFQDEAVPVATLQLP